MKNIKLLAKDYKVYILDLPGFGGSDVVKGKVHNSDLFVEALSHDSTNVKSLAMLSSCYLRLIEVVSKDENYFSVVTRLVEMARTKGVDLQETVIADVATVCMGMAASMGATILSQGKKGKRFALPNSEIMIHQPLTGVEGQASDIQITANHILRLKEKLTHMMADATGQDYKKVEKDKDRDYWMTAEEAKKYGIVDQILKPKKA
jgi:ATP-dependent Clp endopeptidase proteolytic subunit ClpP